MVKLLAWAKGRESGAWTLSSLVHRAVRPIVYPSAHSFSLLMAGCRIARHSMAGAVPGNWNRRIATLKDVISVSDAGMRLLINWLELGYIMSRGETITTEVEELTRHSVGQLRVNGSLEAGRETMQVYKPVADRSML